MTNNEEAPGLREQDQGANDQLTGGSGTTVPPRDGIAQQVRRRFLASLRLPPLPCGHRDPLNCRAECGRAYREAA